MFAVPYHTFQCVMGQPSSGQTYSRSVTHVAFTSTKADGSGRPGADKNIIKNVNTIKVCEISTYVTKRIDNKSRE